MANVHCYIDGFNLYYRLYKNMRRRDSLTGYKWLDLEAVCQKIMPRDQIGHVSYFTADIADLGHNSAAMQRQQTYLNALAANPRLTIVKGLFRLRTKSGIPTDSAHGGAPITVQTFEEKGSDVNLATHLLRDAFTGACDKALVISNDSDIAPAVRSAKDDAGVFVRLISPDVFVLDELRAAASSAGVLYPHVAKQCQLPASVTDQHQNVFVRPRAWGGQDRSN